MTLLRRFIAIFASLSMFVAMPNLSHAEIEAKLAQTYIRALFDTSASTDFAPETLCLHVAQFGRSAAGHAWRLLAPDEQARFAIGFCDMADEAIHRLRIAYPGLQLDLRTVSPSVPGMVMVSSIARMPGQMASWQIDWQVAETGDHLRFADLKLVGLSLGIFLRSLANSEFSTKAEGSPVATDILNAWQQALDRALPPQAKSPPLMSK